MLIDIHSDIYIYIYILIYYVISNPEQAYFGPYYKKKNYANIDYAD